MSERWQLVDKLSRAIMNFSSEPGTITHTNEQPFSIRYKRSFSERAKPETQYEQHSVQISEFTHEIIIEVKAGETISNVEIKINDR